MKRMTDGSDNLLNAQADGLHPTATGEAVIAQALLSNGIVSTWR